MADRGVAAPEEVGASRPARGWVVACTGTGVALVLATAAGALAAGMSWRTFLDAYVLSNLVIGVAFLASGVPIAWFTRNVVGWLFVASGLGHLATAAATAVELYGLGAGWPLLVLEALSTVSTGAWQVGIGMLFPLAVLLFPRVPQLVGTRGCRICGLTCGNARWRGGRSCVYGLRGLLRERLRRSGGV